MEVILSTDLVRIYPRMMAEIDLMKVKYLIDAQFVSPLLMSLTYISTMNSCKTKDTCLLKLLQRST